MSKTKVHNWMPRFPGVVCRHCGVDAGEVQTGVMGTECPLCAAPVGQPCTTSPQNSDDSPRQTPPHAARQRAAGVECGGET